MTRDPKTLRRGHDAAVAGLCLLLALGACSLDKVGIPGLDGPSGLGTLLKISANPDAVTADGHSQSVVVAEVFDQNGKPVVGLSLLFKIQDSNFRDAEIGQLQDVTGNRLGGAATVTTNTAGVAQVIYQAPPRTDFTASHTIVIAVRPVPAQGDATAALYRHISIELITAEPRLFPQNPSDKPPICSFVIEPPSGPYRVNQTVGFQSTAHDDPSEVPPGYIVRYQWNFGDGTLGFEPQEAHVFKFAGTFTVVHNCVDNDGSQGTPFFAALKVF